MDRLLRRLAPERAAGSLLILSFLLPLAALVIMVASGAFSAFASGLQGALAAKAPFSRTFRLLNLLWTAGWVVQLMGFGMLARLLLQAGDETLPIPAFAALSLAAILGVLHGTFHISVETWAAEETARAGTIPAGYEPISLWIGGAFRVGYVSHLAAGAVFGWSALRTGLLPPTVSRFTIGWGLFWLASYLVGAGLPAVLLFTPVGLGAALVRSGPARLKRLPVRETHGS